jgi:hypothetical protein
MAWSYSGNPTSSVRDEVRFILQDTEITLPLLQNEELDYLLSTWMPRYDSVIFVAAVAAAIIARKFAGVVNVNADGVLVNVADISARYTDMATQLRQEYRESQEVGSEVDISNLMFDAMLDPGIAPLTFGKGMHDNLEAGQQDFGGVWPNAAGIDWGRDGGLVEG